MLHHFEFIFHEPSRWDLSIIVEWLMLLNWLLWFGLEHSWILELLGRLFLHLPDFWLRILGLVLNFLNWVHTKVLLEIEISIDWFLSKVAARSTGIGYFSMARYSWLSAGQHRWVECVVDILSICIHLLHVRVFDSRSVKKIADTGALWSVWGQLVSNPEIRIRAWPSHSRLLRSSSVVTQTLNRFDWRSISRGSLWLCGLRFVGLIMLQPHFGFIS